MHIQRPGFLGEAPAICTYRVSPLQLRGLEPGGLGGAFPLGLWSQKCSPSSGKDSLLRATPCSLLRPRGDPVIRRFQTAPLPTGAPLSIAPKSLN